MIGENIMTTLLAMEPLEFLLRYNVIGGMLLAIIGTAICMMAKRITMAKRKQVEISSGDKFYAGLKLIGICFILLGMICIALPLETTFYRG